MKALITLEQVITSVVEKEKNLKEQNFDGEAIWSGVVNFYCMQMNLVMSMRYIFGDEMTCHVHLVFYVISLESRPLIFVYLHVRTHTGSKLCDIKSNYLEKLLDCG